MERILLSEATAPLQACASEVSAMYMGLRKRHLKIPHDGFMAVNGPAGYAMLISPNRDSCLMLSLSGVYCCVRASGTGTHFWVVWIVLVYRSLSMVMKNTTSGGI